MKLRMNNTVEFSKWLAEEDIDVTSPNLDMEDFGSFLEKMRAKNKVLGKWENYCFLLVYAVIFLVFWELLA